MAWFLLGMYGLFALISLSNFILMVRPKASGKSSLGTKHPDESFIVLIPARDEEANLRRLLPSLVHHSRVVVCDDESSDATGSVSAELGAEVIRSESPLPAGWTGKNWACHRLAQYALANSDAEWLLFLDADVCPLTGFASGFCSLAKGQASDCGVVTGFPTIVAGRWPEPLFLGWVGWILLCTNPYGLVNASRSGHSRFTNGQFHAWRRDVYRTLMPNETVRNAVLEDVKMGRLCAKHNVPVLVANVSSILSVKMYETWREALDGMSKNAHEITDSTVGTLLLAVLMLVIAWGWIATGALWPIGFGLLLLSGSFCQGIVRARTLGILLLPIALTIGSFTLVRSLVWRKKGAVRWKGRTYGAN